MLRKNIEITEIQPTLVDTKLPKTIVLDNTTYSRVYLKVSRLPSLTTSLMDVTTVEYNLNVIQTSGMTPLVCSACKSARNPVESCVPCFMSSSGCSHYAPDSFSCKQWIYRSILYRSLISVLAFFQVFDSSARSSKA